MPKYLEPLIRYLEAKELSREGKETQAAETLGQAFGSNKSTPFLENNIGIALNEQSPAGQVVLDGIFGEMKWIQRKIAIPRKR